jgi:siderophore synthetase component
MNVGEQKYFGDGHWLLVHPWLCHSLVRHLFKASFTGIIIAYVGTTKQVFC